MGPAKRRGARGDGTLTRLLLDSHALLWWFADPKSLSPVAATALADPANDVLVSPVNGYELAYKHKLGKLERAGQMLADLGVQLIAHRFGRLDVSLDHALLGGRLDWAHRDPFDRLLVAQALAEDLTLVSNEWRFDVTGVRRVW